MSVTSQDVLNLVGAMERMQQVLEDIRDQLQLQRETPVRQVRWEYLEVRQYVDEIDIGELDDWGERGFDMACPLIGHSGGCSYTVGFILKREVPDVEG